MFLLKDEHVDQVGQQEEPSPVPQRTEGINRRSRRFLWALFNPYYWSNRRPGPRGQAIPRSSLSYGGYYGPMYGASYYGDPVVGVDAGMQNAGYDVSGGYDAGYGAAECGDGGVGGSCGAYAAGGD